MSRLFETKEITKLLDTLIGKVEAIGETNEDNRRLNNLKTLIDVTDWCLDRLQFAMASGYGRPEYSMAEISHTAYCALDEYEKWIADILEEQMSDRKTENSSEKSNNCDTCKFELYCPKMCEGCCEWDSHYEPKDEPQMDYTPDCPFCKRYGTEDCLGFDCRHYKTYKDKPQIEGI